MRITIRIALVVALAAGVVGCSGDSTSNDGTATPDQSTLPGEPIDTIVQVDPGTVYPLTGLPITDAAAAARPALVVKIDNDADAGIQSGLNAADIVFEQIIEVQTRFAAVFHSQGSDPVGPIRSGRTQDIDLLGSFNQPLFVWSGGNPGVTAAIEASDLVELSALDNSVYTDGGFFRDETRVAPHDEFAATTELWTLAPDDAGPPPPQFQYRGADEELVGQVASGVDVYLEGLLVGWRYDAASGNYLRMRDGLPNLDASSEQLSTRNVIVMVVQYSPSAVDERSPDADTIGYGEAWVFSDGIVVQGVWTRANRLSPIKLTGPDGAITLAPGRTWVELAKSGAFTAVP